MKKICIIVGHGKSKTGGYDSGAVSKDGKIHEFKVAREIAKNTVDYLNANYEITADLMNYDGDLYLTDRIKKVNANKYDFIAEVHLNAGGGTGVETYYYHGSRKGQKYADKICDYIADALKFKQRANYGDDREFDIDKDGGDKTKLGKGGKDYFAIVRDTKPTAVLIETAFIDTASDLNKVKTADGQKKCGEAIGQAIADVGGLKKKTTTPTTPTTSTATKPTSGKTATVSQRYFKKYTGKSSSIVDGLVAVGADHSFNYRKKIAVANGVQNYIGTPTQNLKLLNLLKQGRLVMP